MPDQRCPTDRWRTGAAGDYYILGGGDIESIYKAYVAAITESAFFRKLLHLDEQETAKPKKSSAKTEQKSSPSEE